MQPLRTLIILVTLLLTASTVLTAPASAQAATRDFGAESGFLSSVNGQRASAGLAPLALSGSMTSAADSWTIEMVNGSFLAHASDIVTGTPSGWTKVGENVGRGQSVSSLTSAFMASPGHQANIMDATYTHIGIAVYNHPTDGRMYTTHRFAALPGSAPAPTAVPTAAPTATPVPPTPVPPTPVPPTPVPATPVPTAIPATPVPTAIPATPVPATPVPATPVPATPVPTAVTAAQAPTATPIPPTATPVPTEVPATPTPEPTAIPATAVPATPDPTATAIPATAVPATPTPAATPDTDFGTPPEQLAFVDADSIDEAARAKLASKTAKFSS